MRDSETFDQGAPGGEVSVDGEHDGGDGEGNSDLDAQHAVIAGHYGVDGDSTAETGVIEKVTFEKLAGPSKAGEDEDAGGGQSKA